MTAGHLHCMHWYYLYMYSRCTDPMTLSTLQTHRYTRHSDCMATFDTLHGTLLLHVHVAQILWHISRSYSCAPLHGISSFPIPLSSLHGFSAYHCYMCIYCLFLLVIWIPVHITCIIVSCYRIHVIWLFPVTDIDILVTGHELLICDVCHPTSTVSRFPLSC